MDTHATRMGMGMGTILYPHMDMGFSWVENILWWVWIWVGDTHWVQTHCKNRFCRFAVAWVATFPVDFALDLLSWFFAKLLCYLACNWWDVVRIISKQGDWEWCPLEEVEGKVCLLIPTCLMCTMFWYPPLMASVAPRKMDSSRVLWKRSRARYVCSSQHVSCLLCFDILHWWRQ
jgi:hypothetical protein